MHKRIVCEMLRACLEEIVKIRFDPKSKPEFLKKDGTPNISLIIRTKTSNSKGTNFKSTVWRYYKRLESEATERGIERKLHTRDNRKKIDK